VFGARDALSFSKRYPSQGALRGGSVLICVNFSDLRSCSLFLTHKPSKGCMSVISIFRDRADAGQQLAKELVMRKLQHPVVLALPRGGVPVACEIARTLLAPLDLVLVRKIGHPWQPELALAAIVDGPEPIIVVNEDVRAATIEADKYIAEATKRELLEIERRRALYLKGRPRVAVKDAAAIVVDDGVATGATVRAALRALRRQMPGRLILAVPVAPEDTIASLKPEADEIICLHTPKHFFAIGPYYQSFAQVSDEQVIADLSSLHAAQPASPAPPPVTSG
jgi:putative phosphoribosyl transferase